MPGVTLKESDQKASDFVNVAIDVPDLCHRYTARVITGVKVGPSPAWLIKRLETIGLRSINNVVDATNYVMMETGQPSHAFDYDTLKGKKIVVRKGIKGERLVSIDGTKCDMDENTLAIADGERAVAIAGVMGGLDTEVSDKTTTVLLEVAHFNPVSVRTSSRKLVLSSDASFRFERHVDTQSIGWVSDRLAAMIAELSGGTVARGIVDAYPAKEESASVQMRLSRMKALLGIEIPEDFVISCFAALGLEPVKINEDVIECKSPSWRHDISREVDLIEEAARSYGFDKVPVEPKIHIEITKPDKFQQVSAKARQVLTGAGFFETLNVTFTSPRLAELFADNAPAAHM